MNYNKAPVARENIPTTQDGTRNEWTSRESRKRWAAILEIETRVTCRDIKRGAQIQISGN